MAKPLLQAGSRRVVLPRIRPYQEDLYSSPARFKLTITGRRWGKGKVCLFAVCDGHGPRHGEWRQWRGALQGARIGVVVPSDKHVAAAEWWRDLKVALGPSRVSISEEARQIVVPGGGSVQILSGYDPESLRGTYLDGVVIDECSAQDVKVWQVIRPTLSDYGGWAILSGNVPEDVVGHWFIRLYFLSTTPQMAARGWWAWRRPSWENPQLTEADLAEARETLGTRVYLREYGAELVGVEGGVWREEWFQDRYWTELPSGNRAILCLDAAWKTGVRNDYSAAQLWLKTSTDYYLVDELHGRWESPELRRRVGAFREAWLPRFDGQALPVYVEEAGGGAVHVQEFSASVDFPVLPHPIRSSTKLARNEAVSPLAEARKVWLPSPRIAPWVPAYVAELVGFPDLPHDDRCDATSMALEILRGSVEAARAVLRPRPQPPVALIERGGYA